ncbi:unnamed protein product [Ceutorhynchus assimilis]|uniref:Uncharacterized protein n=1 Tax=Ceutorhynchus assimilis TaxID=467358 RepID=A0A9N9MU19_9CUCU|nr:unnamed protein product [Ceutorhynchus assimilis]
MSINVTVTGNPVSIKRGKMITSSDPEAAKKEFEQKRLMRLEQVRKQSKQLAQDVRNKVKQEKKRQLGEMEKEGKEKLKSWQNQKLLELQNQYLNSLKEMGLGHKVAEKYADESAILEVRQQENKEVARNRGKLAEAKQQVQKNEEKFKKVLPIQHKKIVRDIENTRAALVSTLGKCYNNKQLKTKKPTKANINISIPNDSDFSEASSSSESSKPHDIQQESNNDSDQSCDHNSEGFCECSDEKPVQAEPNSDSFRFASELDLESKTLKQKKSRDTSYKDSLDEQRKIIENFRNRTREVPVDTRISDRIKRRELMVSQPDYCDFVADPCPLIEVDEITKIRDKVSARSTSQQEAPLNKDPLQLSTETMECVNTKFHNCCPCHSKETVSKSTTVDRKSAPASDTKSAPASKFKKGPDSSSKIETVTSGAYKASDFSEQDKIPTKPPIKLKDAGQQTSKVDSMQSSTLHVNKFVEAPKRSVQSTKPRSTTSGAQKVRQYDHPNRFIRDVPSTSNVEKISADSIEVVPNITSEREWHEKMKQRDLEAQIRGKRAMEKEKVQRDYEEMMKKLPILQRKRQISEIGTDKPEYHMSEERLRKRERERQNRLENAYTQAIPDLKPQIVTLPSRQHEPPMTNEPFEILDGDDARVLNLGKWDTDSRPKTMFSAEEVQEIIRAFTVQKPEDRKTKLKQLLKSLKLQKEQLINEIRALPPDDSINALLGDLTSFSDSDEKRYRSSKHKTKDKDKSERKRRREKSDTSASSSDTSLEKKKDADMKSTHKDKKYRSPQKKSKKRDYKVRVLQNTSTQTTPKPTKEKSSTSSSTTTTTSSSNQQQEKHETVGSSKSHGLCKCLECPDKRKDCEEVCKILIKLGDNDSPKVEVVKGASSADKEKRRRDEAVPKSPERKREKSSKSPRTSKPLKSQSTDKENISPLKRTSKRTELRSVGTTDDVVFKKPLPKPIKKNTLEKEKKTSPRRKNESWKERFSKNSTSSTSYLGRPDFSTINSTASTDISKQSEFYPRKKPHQTRLKHSMPGTPGEDSQIDPRLLQYVKRLLSMSRNSVDELGVSSSNVPTPSQSIIEIESNNPKAQLRDIMSFINAQSEIARHLDSSDDRVHAPPNSSAGHSDIKDQDITMQIPEKDDNSKTKEHLLTQFADVTDCCTQRIANLAAMIEQLRQEKIHLLQSPPLSQAQNSPRADLVLLSPISDKDNSSTQYLQFPPAGEKSKGTNSTTSMNEEELNRRLLDIDMSLADKLKQYAKDESPKINLVNTQTESTQPTIDDSSNQTDQHFLQRLQNLIQESHHQEPTEEDVNNHLPEINKEVPFIPFLVDIPKLPILEPEPEGFDDTVPTKRYPPPSKGLIAAKKFNGDIPLMIPHELSTIVEADSSKISPNNSKLVIPLSPTMEEPTLPTDETVVEESVVDKDSCPNFAFSSSGSQVTSTTSSGELRSVEDMLKSIGMDWAISTLQKTKESLGLSPGSTSEDLSSIKKCRSQKSPSNTEVSLKEFLKKQAISKISSSSMKSEASPASFAPDRSDLSAIQANSSTEKAKQQKTSTPVLSKSTSNSQEDQLQFSTGASDLSSVRNGSNEQDQQTGKMAKVTFQSLPGDEELSS